MKKVTFIRHYKLEYPFDSKENITSEQYAALSKGEIDVSINRDVEDYCLNKLDRHIYETWDLILSGPAKRTLESAVAIKSAFKLKAPIEINHDLKECIWDPDFPGERITRFLQGTDLSIMRETWDRVAKLDLYLKRLIYNNVLCVTHSFFMQIVYLYYFGNFKDYKDIDYNHIKNSFHGDYLMGFEVPLE